MQPPMPAVDRTHCRTHIESIRLTFLRRCLVIAVCHRLLDWNPAVAAVSLPFYYDSNRIYIAGLFPMTTLKGEDENAAGVLPSVLLALEHVNDNGRILPNHILDLEWNDTKCDMAVGSKVFFDMMHNPPSKVVVFGDACSEVTVPIAETAVWWNVPQLSYADTNPILSDRTKYPNFFRTVPSDTDFNLARIQLLHHFQWNRVATLFQDASTGTSRHAIVHSKLTEQLDYTTIHRETESFLTDPKPALLHLKQKDLRIILGDFDAEMARLVFCSAHELKLYGAKYLWILAGSYSDGWWRVADSKCPCSPTDLYEALQGFIATDLSTLSSSHEKTIAGKTPRQYERLYNTRRGKVYSKFHGYAYDGIWVVANAIDAVIRQNRGRYNVADFHGERFQQELNRTNFFGVTGRVVFKNGDRIGNIVLKQFQSGEMVKIGEIDTLTNILNLTNRLRWTGIGPPRDGSHKVHQLQTVSLIIYVSISSLASLGIILTIFFLVINIRFRNHRYIKMSSPNMNNIILAGCTLAYFSVFLLGIDGQIVGEKLFPLACSLKIWVFSLGFTLSFGAMFSKTWRVHSIFTNVKMNRKAIKDYQLVVIVNLLLLVDLIILSTWQIVDPPFRQTKDLSPQSDPLGGDIEIIPYIEFCISHHMTIFLVALYVYKGLLLVVGCFLAWETRQVTITALNDSKYIGMSVYNTVITCVSGVPVTFLVSDRPDGAYLLIALFVIFSTTVTLCLVFGPKLLEIRRDPRGEEKQTLKSMRKFTKKMPSRDSTESIVRQKITDLAFENQRFRDVLEAKQQEIANLLRLLGKPTTPPTSSHRLDNASQCDSLRNSSFLQRTEPDRFYFEKSASYATIDRSKNCIELNDIRTVVPISIRTPSYQGLKFLDQLQLRETAILSDFSDADNSPFTSPTDDHNNFFQGQEEVTKSLLS